MASDPLMKNEPSRPTEPLRAEQSLLAQQASTGVVTIGRNEGERLRRGLEALRRLLPQGAPIVYVDSGSTDGSVELARSYGVDVVELDMSRPFNMARGRNTGFDHLFATYPDIHYVQFIDGDCEVVADWIDTAIRELNDHPDVAVVFGRCRERHPDASIYNRLADMEWNAPIGEAKYCHGNSMMRVAAFDQVGRFNEALIAGEEPELCVRLRQAGWKIYRIDAEMTLHDAAMTRFSQWWRRSVRGGWAYAQGAHLHGKPPERHKVREARSVWFWGLLLPVLAVMLAWPTGGWSLLALLGYPALFTRIALHRLRRRNAPFKEAVMYAFFAVLAKFPQVAGQLRYHLHRMRGREATLIEYKAPQPAAPPSNATDSSASPGAETSQGARCS